MPEGAFPECNNLPGDGKDNCVHWDEGQHRCVPIQEAINPLNRIRNMERERARAATLKRDVLRFDREQLERELNQLKAVPQGANADDLRAEIDRQNVIIHTLIGLLDRRAQC